MKNKDAVESGVGSPAHYPGPWHADEGDVYDARGKVVLQCLTYEVATDTERRDANAALAAAAPELRDFAQQQYDSTYCICDLNRIGGTDVSCTRCEAAALLAKVERAQAEPLVKRKT